jgi:hypothetical protein
MTASIVATLSQILDTYPEQLAVPSEVLLHGYLHHHQVHVVRCAVAVQRANSKRLATAMQSAIEGDEGAAGERSKEQGNHSCRHQRVQNLQHSRGMRDSSLADADNRGHLGEGSASLWDRDCVCLPAAPAD